MPPPPEISVLIGAQDARASLGGSLEAVLGQLAGRNGQVVVADASIDGSADLVAERFPTVELLRAASGWLVPQLWGLALERARAPLVALLSGHCVPQEGWLETLLCLARDRPEYVGFGGPIEGPIGGSGRDWAVYFARYTAYLPPVEEGEAEEIPGDNAAYRKAALDRVWTSRNEGFWETLVHRRLRAAGDKLLMAPGVRVRLGRTEGVRRFAVARLRHGRHYGSTRPTASAGERLLRVAAAPALMPLLLLRIGRRVSAHRPDLMPAYLRSLPWLVLWLGAWTVGEVSGYLEHRGTGS